MKLTFLGTGTSQGIPVIGCECRVCKSPDSRDKRLRVSAILEVDSKCLLFDIGPDFRSQMLTNGFTNIDAVFLTHEHNDHVAGLDDIRPINFKYQKNIPVYSLKRVLNQVRAKFDYAFAEKKYPGAPSLVLHEIEQEPVAIGPIVVQPIAVQHGNLPILGFRVGDLAYLTDVKSISNQERSKLNGLDVLVINALQKKPHFSHLTLKEALKLINELKPRRAFLTHLSHSLGSHIDVQNELVESNVQLAYDGLQINL